MPNPFISLFIFAELSFYLIIAQTGIVEFFHSDITVLFTLPLGGMIGTMLGGYLQISEKMKTLSFLSLQIFLSFLYPQYNIMTLFLLGISIGTLSPIIIQTLKRASTMEFIFSISAAYVFGTFLFPSDVANRGLIAILLSILAVLSYLFHTVQLPHSSSHLKNKTYRYPLYLMTLWVFLDAALFESLSRDTSLSIWRDGYSIEIILFHILGVFVAFFSRMSQIKEQFLIAGLFLMSYFMYFIHEALLLSIIYPFVISYYNITILKTLIQIKSIKNIALYMLCIGWLASGAGLIVALSQSITVMPLFIFLALFPLHHHSKLFQFKYKELSYE